MPIDIEEIRDKSGELRRLGSLTLPDNFVSSFPPYEGSPECPLWDDADIKRVISDPNRRKPELLFPSTDGWIKNQRSHGSCNGFALATAIDRARYLRGIRDDWRASGAFPYSLMNGGRDQGSALEDGLIIAERNGVCSEEIVGWDQIYPSQYDKEAAHADAAKHKGLGCYRALTKQGFRSGLAAGFVGIVAVMAGSRYQQFRNGIAGVDNGMGNHAVCVCDLRLKGGTEVYLQEGSWGVNGWGDGGRGFLVWDHFAQTFKQHAFYLIPSTLEGPR